MWNNQYFQKANTVEEAIAKLRHDLKWVHLTPDGKGGWEEYWPWSTNGTTGANAESFAQIDGNAEDL